MLTLHFVSSPHDSRVAFQAFDPLQATWIVSDLKSKLELNRQLLSKREFVPGESVLRASELWRLVLGRLRPDLQIVSREFTLTLLAQKLSQSAHEWARAPGASKATLEYMTQLMPVLAHPAGQEMMSEWFEANPTIEARWGRWFRLSTELWREFLDDGFIAPFWASGVLANESLLNEAWSKNLYVDLGAELDQVEADLLVQISAHVDVTVLVPETSWSHEYAKSLTAYEVFEKKLKVRKTKSVAVPIEKSTVSYCKYTTMIAEVKDAVAQIRLWLDAGAKDETETKALAIAAPDIEMYWPALSAYLEQEGIPCQKDHVRRLHTYPDIARWLARLRLRSGAFGESDIELALFDEDSVTLSYERFKTLYSAIYVREDVDRSKEVAEKFAIDLRPLDLATRDEFIAWSLKHLGENVDFDRVELSFKRLFSECPQGLRLSAQRWLAYFEQLVAKSECRIADGDPNGIACINLSSAENSPAKQMIVLGLTESALKPIGGTAILMSDVLSLARDFGFHLVGDEQANLEFAARWIIADSARSLMLAVAETDFAGAPQAPSWLWVRGAREAGVHDRMSLPRPTRWDEIQQASLSSIAHVRQWPLAQVGHLSKAMQQDLDEVPLENFGQGLITSLSPSGIEDYLDCPFVFAAKRIFSLSDIAELDLEVDPSRRGNLMHKLFEFLTREPIRFDLTDEELGAVVDEARAASRIELADAKLWPALRARHVDLGRRFLDFEREYRRSFPDGKTIAREADIAGFLDPETGALVRERGALKTALRFVGRIDRVDSDSEKNLAVYDYKSSLGSVSQYGTWLKKNQIQLLLYAMAIENGLSTLAPQPVLAALYYVAKPLNRDNGFKVVDAEQGLYDAADKRKRNRITLDEKQKIFTLARARIKEAVDGILAGGFAPKPLDANNCKTCQWSSLCRAPHLNS